MIESNTAPAALADKHKADGPRGGSHKRSRRRHGLHGEMPDGVPDMTGARWFVTAIFLALGASFIAWTALFIYEFRDEDWLALLFLHSHLLLFYPTLGLLELAAFHLPATVFTHMYWTHIAHGRVRFGIGRPPPFWDPSDWVLAKFSGDEENQLDDLIEQAAAAAETALEEGALAAMNKFNRRAGKGGAGAAKASDGK